MIAKILKLKNEPLIAGSFWLTVGGLLANFGNYIFNLLMGRMLTPGEYGALISLISLTMVVSLPSAIITTVVTKFSADFFARKEIFKITRLIRRFTKYTLLLGLGVFIVFILASSFINDFFNIKSVNLVILTGIMVSFSLVSSINHGVLRGLLFFKILAFLGIITVLIKLLFGWYSVSNHYAVFGALLAIFLSNFISWLISFYPIRHLLKETRKESFGLRKKILSFSLPTFLVTAATTLFLNSDLLLVKHFFNAEEAGIYVSSSIMGRAIFYALSPIPSVLFPIVSQKFAKGKEVVKELVLGMFLTLLAGLFGVLFYFSHSDFIVKVFFPNPSYQKAEAIIGFYALYMLVYALVSLLIQFFLVVENKKICYISLCFSVLQAITIAIFHKSLLQIIFISIAILCCLLLVLLYHLLKIAVKQKKLKCLKFVKY